MRPRLSNTRHYRTSRVPLLTNPQSHGLRRCHMPNNSHGSCPCDFFALSFGRPQAELHSKAPSIALAESHRPPELTTAHCLYNAHSSLTWSYQRASFHQWGSVDENIACVSNTNIAYDSKQYHYVKQYASNTEGLPIQTKRRPDTGARFTNSYRSVHGAVAFLGEPHAECAIDVLDAGCASCASVRSAD